MKSRARIASSLLQTQVPAKILQLLDVCRVYPLQVVVAYPNSPHDLALCWGTSPQGIVGRVERKATQRNAALRRR
jgi:hypothetical protein